MRAPVPAPSSSPLSAPSSRPAPASRPSSPSPFINSIISEALYIELFPKSLSAECPQVKGFYTYQSFLDAASYFPEFGSVGDEATRIREVAALLAQVSQETTGGTPGRPDQFEFGLCFKAEVSPWSDYCNNSNLLYPCQPGRSYKGRGPIQLSWNYNYGQAGTALGYPLLYEPELVENDALISCLTAFWIWMTPQAPKPSCHDVMAGVWKPSSQDVSAGRLPGFGLTTNIINGGIECGQGVVLAPQQGRIDYFKRYLGVLGGTPGDNLDCARMQSYGFNALVDLRFPERIISMAGGNAYRRQLPQAQL